MQSCGMSCIKYLLFVFNLLFAIAGIALIVVGGLILGKGNYTLLEGHGKGPAIGLIVIGSIIFITAFLGCCGAIKENYCMLISFAVILIIIFIAQLSVGITAAVYKDSFKTELRKELNDSLKTFYSETVVREAWNEVQKDFKCCGLDGPEDWNYGRQVPASCCNNADETVSEADQTCDKAQVVHKEGCYDKVAMFLKDGFIIVAGVGIGIAFIELAGAILACFLAKSIRKEECDVA